MANFFEFIFRNILRMESPCVAFVTFFSLLDTLTAKIKDGYYLCTQTITFNDQRIFYSAQAATRSAELKIIRKRQAF
jgi:hypothetical protein